MGTFNPGNGQARMGWETLVEIPPAAASMHDFEFLGEEVGNEQTRIESESISPNSMRPPKLPGNVNSGGPLNVELDAEGHSRFLADIQRKSDTPVDLDTATTWLHRLHPSATDIVFPDSYTQEFWRDDDMGQQFKGTRTGGMEVSIADGSLVNTSFELLSNRGDYWADPTTDAGGPTAGLPTLRGLPEYSRWTPVPTTGNIQIEVSVAPSGGSMSVKAFYTEDGSAGATATVVVLGEDTSGVPIWTTLIDSNTGAIMGTRDLPIQAYFPDVAFLLADAWTFARQRATAWTPALPDLPKMNEIFVTITIDGVEYCIETLTLTVTRPLEPKHCIGGRFAKFVLEQGQRIVEGTLERRYMDTTLRKRLERGEPFILGIEMYSGEEISGGYEHAIKMYSPHCVFEGKSASITDRSTFQEPLDFSCHGDATHGTYPDDLTIDIISSESTLET